MTDLATNDGITIRLLDESDAGALRRLAERDSSSVPRSAALGAVRGGHLIAAIELEGGGSAIADPFQRTADAVALLRIRLGQLRGERRRRIRSVGQDCSSGAIVSPAAASCSQ